MNINVVEIGKRLKNIREFFNMTQKEFAEAVNLHQSLLSDMEKGKRNVSFNTIIAIAEYNNMININYLINGVGDVITESKPTNQNTASSTGNSVQVIDKSVQVNTVQSKNNLLVPIAAFGGYLGEWTQEYVSQELVYIKVPGEPHRARTFEVSGSSMEPVINHGDYVVCRPVEKMHQVKDGHIYVVVSSLSGISVKYVHLESEFLVLEPANLSIFGSNVISFDDVKEVWEVVLKITGDISTTSDEPVRSRIDAIEQFLYKQNPKWKGV